MINFKNKKILGIFSFTILALLFSSSHCTFAMDQTSEFPSTLASQDSPPTLDEVNELIVKAKAGDLEAQRNCMVLYRNGAYQKQLTPTSLNFFS